MVFFIDDLYEYSETISDQVRSGIVELANLARKTSFRSLSNRARFGAFCLISFSDIPK